MSQSNKKNSYLELFVKSNKWSVQNEQMEMDKMTISEMDKMTISEMDKMTTPIPNNKK